MIMMMLMMMMMMVLMMMMIGDLRPFLAQVLNLIEQ